MIDWDHSNEMSEAPNLKPNPIKITPVTLFIQVPMQGGAIHSHSFVQLQSAA